MLLKEWARPQHPHTTHPSHPAAALIVFLTKKFWQKFLSELDIIPCVFYFLFQTGLSGPRWGTPYGSPIVAFQLSGGVCEREYVDEELAVEWGN